MMALMRGLPSSPAPFWLASKALPASLNACSREPGQLEVLDRRSSSNTHVAVSDQRSEVDGAASDEIDGGLVAAGTVAEGTLDRELLDENSRDGDGDVVVAHADL